MKNRNRCHIHSIYYSMILTFQTSFPTVDEEDRYADIDVPKTRTVDDVPI